MKSTIKVVFVILAVVITFVAVQSVGAKGGKNITEVSGMIEDITYQPNVVVVDGTEIYGIKFDYLCNQYTICLEEGEEVTVEYYEFVCDNGTIKAMASSITVGDVTVKLR